MADFKGMNGMIALKRVALICVSLVLAGLAGCSSSSTHIAYVTLPTSNSIAAFRVSNHSGKFTSVVGSPFAGGNSPNSIVLDPANKFAYAANQTGNDISLFMIDSSTGGISEVMPRTRAGISPVALAMDFRGRLLIRGYGELNRYSRLFDYCGSRGSDGIFWIA